MDPLRTLRQCLIDVELARLRVMARMWGLELKASRPLEAAAELAERMVVPAHAADMWKTLTGEQQAALESLLAAGGSMPTAVFARRFGEIRPIGPGRLERETPWRNPISLAEGLWYRGLVFEGFAKDAGEIYPVFFVPAELRAVLPTKAGAQDDLRRLAPVDPPAYRYSEGALLLDDLTTILSFAHNRAVRPRGGSPGAWPADARQDLSRFLRNPDARRLDFCLHLVEHLGWTRIGEDDRVRLVAEPVIAWLRQAPQDSRALLIDAWRTMMGWDELWKLTALQPDETGTWRHDPTLARAGLLRFLEALAAGEWVRIADFVNGVKGTDPDFQRPGGDYEAWYVRHGNSGVYLTGFESWDQVEGVLLRALLSGPAHWLGLVDLGARTEGDPPQLFCRVTETDPAPVVKLPASVVRPDLTVTVPAGLRFERFQLARVADLERTDDSYVYRLTSTSLDRARQQRIGPARVVDFLDGLDDAPLPATVRSSLIRWSEQGIEVWLEQTILLRVADEALMQQIITSPKTGRYIERQIAATMAVVAEQDWPRLVAGLAELGLLTQVVGVGDRWSESRDPASPQAGRSRV